MVAEYKGETYSWLTGNHERMRRGVERTNCSAALQSDRMRAFLHSGLSITSRWVGTTPEGGNRVIDSIGTSLNFLRLIEKIRLPAPDDLPEFLPVFIIGVSEIVLRGAAVRKRLDKFLLTGGVAR